MAENNTGSEDQLDQNRDGVTHGTAAPNNTIGEDQVDHSRGVTYGIVNGIFIRKIPVTVVVYPEIACQINEMIRVMEYVYELGIRRGVAVDRQVPQPIVQDPTLSTTD